MPHTILCIHGGTVFDSYEAYRTYLETRTLTLERLRINHDWKDTLSTRLGQEFDVLVPRMPNPMNAVYDEWALTFSRILPLIEGDLTLVGHSLGGVFLARYLTMNDLARPIRATFLLAAPYLDDVPGESLGDFLPPTDLSRFGAHAGEIYLYHSIDDPVVPFAHHKEYAALLPHATTRTLDGYGHFNTATLPELEHDIRSLTDRSLLK